MAERDGAKFDVSFHWGMSCYIGNGYKEVVVERRCLGAIGITAEVSRYGVMAGT